MKKVIVLLFAMFLTISLACSQFVTIGNQVWMQKNLDVSHYRNADPILHAKTAKEWIEAGEKGIDAWRYYDNDPKNFWKI